VAAEAAVPGVFNKMAEREPPYVVLIYRTAKRISAGPGFMPYVIGRNRGSAVRGPIPGRKPIVKPMRLAPKTIAIFCHWKTISAADNHNSREYKR